MYPWLRFEAVNRAVNACNTTRIAGVVTNISYMRNILQLPEFVAGDTPTTLLPKNHARLIDDDLIEVVKPGFMTTIQDWPGRVGYWHAGIPPSGPMDAFSFRLANALVGNDPGAPALEILAIGQPLVLLFPRATSIALTGAEMKISLQISQSAGETMTLDDGGSLQATVRRGGAGSAVDRPVPKKPAASKLGSASSGDSVTALLDMQRSFSSPSGSSTPSSTNNLQTWATVASQEDLAGKMEFHWNSVVHVPAGARLRLEVIKDTEAPTGLRCGLRAYMAIAGGGIQVPRYLGSAATFMLGHFGGLKNGAVLSPGDLLPLSPLSRQQLPAEGLPTGVRSFLPLMQFPAVAAPRWEIGVVFGPHGADFFQQEFLDELMSHEWKVHYDSSRLGVRLRGPTPRWMRTDGGDAGLHPSNIHDCAYAIGAMNFTGDSPVLLTMDGPSLGGFVCPVVVPRCQQWKVGQLRPGDRVQFVRMSVESAWQQWAAQKRLMEVVATAPGQSAAAALAAATAMVPYTASDYRQPILVEHAATERTPRVVVRMAGDNNVLVEYGPLELDLQFRFRVQALMTALRERLDTAQIVDMSPGVRSVLIEYAPERLSLAALLACLNELEQTITTEAVKQVTVPSRLVRLPLAFDDRWNKSALELYSQVVRSEAPYLPSNVDFVARINGLPDAAAVRDIMQRATYMVLGLGDVYLGAPCAVPLNPAHRLVTSKFNPTRTTTPEGSVGIGGAYMCIYGMESPGGYQLMGRTLSIWNTYRTATSFSKPWLLRWFDRVQFYLVSDEELERLRADFNANLFQPQIEENAQFSLGDYERELAGERDSIRRFQETRTAAFELERQKWAAAGMIGGQAAAADADDDNRAPDSIASMDGRARAGDLKTAAALAHPGAVSVDAVATGVILSVHCAEGEMVSEGALMFVVESMKVRLAGGGFCSGLGSLPFLCFSSSFSSTSFSFLLLLLILFAVLFPLLF